MSNQADQLNQRRSGERWAIDWLPYLTDSTRNVGSYTTAVVSPELARIAERLGGHNLVNNSEYPYIADMVADCADWLSRLWHREDHHAPYVAVSGSTEAAMLAGLAALHRWKRTGAGERPNLVASSGAHVCWKRFCTYWDVELRTVEAPGDTVVADPAALARACDEHTILAVATLGYPEHGLFDDVAALAAALRDQGRETPLHVDAASGGFTAPFLSASLPWDFIVPAVVSISASGHKFGQTSLGLGWTLWRDAEHCPQHLWHGADYIGNGKRDIGLTFSRSLAPVAQQAHLFTRAGAFDRYRYDLRDCSSLTATIAAALRGDPDLKVLNDGHAIPVVAFVDRQTGAVERFTSRMGEDGWIVPTYPLECNPRLGQCGRIVVKPGLSTPARDRLMASVLRAIRPQALRL
ncbi:pyridoxal-dependent decarboxylase [Promicromonospora panici]|uniref:pyridoxal-dependent decarboxylase n=1 Tax=Promicromonospora panici TaxID=2219658 RepID=UPI0013ED19EA|nr:pyridoxal-dependent decarboxylase [Promicromonospora panici]